jgi:hypothetical protein
LLKRRRVVKIEKILFPTDFPEIEGSGARAIPHLAGTGASVCHAIEPLKMTRLTTR